MQLNHTITSESRIKIEAVLKSATGPLSAVEISEQSGVSISITRTHLGNAMHKGRVHNLFPRSRCNALYVWGSGKEEFRKPSPRFVPTGTYDGADLKPFAGREGAMKAFELGSMENGSVVPHRAPMLLTA